MIRGGFIALRIVAAGSVVAVLAPETPGSIPFLVLSVASVAGARLIAFGMKPCCLIERNIVARMCRAEDMATVPAMMFAHEEIEVGLALR